MTKPTQATNPPSTPEFDALRFEFAVLRTIIEVLAELNRRDELCTPACILVERAHDQMLSVAKALKGRPG